MRTISTAPEALAAERVTELVTLAAYERLRVDVALAHGTELVSWDEQNPKMRADLRESVEPTVLDTIEVIAELGYAVVPHEWLGGPASDSTVVVVEHALTDGSSALPEVDIDLPAGSRRLLESTSRTPGPTAVARDDEPSDPGALRGLVSGAGSAAVAITRLPQSALRPIKRAVARVLGPAA